MVEVTLCDGTTMRINEEDIWIFELYPWHSSTRDYIRWQSGSEPRRVEHIHRLITNCPDGMDVDHINNDPTDNTRANLRIVTRRQNALRAGPHANKASSRYKGVFFREKEHRWTVSMRINGRYKYIGCFKDEEAAAHAYDDAARKYHGEFAYLNFPDHNDELQNMPVKSARRQRVKEAW